MNSFFLLFGILGIIFLNKKPAVAELLNYDEIYKKWGEKYGVEWELIKAVAIVESSENPKAVNPNDPSYGLMQILFPATLNIENWPPQNKEKLFDPDYNVQCGTQILKWNQDSFGFVKGIAVYNRWESRNDPDNGPFGNQTYVDKVLAQYSALGGASHLGFNTFDGGLIP